NFNKHPLYKGVDLPEGSYAGQGAGGHHLIIIPVYMMVVVRRVDTDIPGNRAKDFGPGLQLILEARLAKKLGLNSHINRMTCSLSMSFAYPGAHDKTLL